MKRSINIISTWVGAVLALALLSIIMALPTQWLWNTCLVPAVDGVNPVGFWQALGLNVLASILFKNSQTKKTES